MQIPIRLSTRPLLAVSLALGSLCSGASALAQERGEAPRRIAGADFDQDHALLTRVLQNFVVGDGVDYRTLKENRGALDTYVTSLHGVTPRQLQSWTREQQFAFWINVYNAHVLQLIVENYPIGSINDLSSREKGEIWDRPFIAMPAHNPSGEGKRLSLNDVENKILRPVFEDARVHAAVNCASESCPPLLNEAFTGAKLERQLQSQMKKFVNDSKRNHLMPRQNAAELSKIFDWFKGDFERDAKSVPAFLARYIDGDATWLRDARIGYLDYSWKLNETNLVLKDGAAKPSEAGARVSFDQSHATLTRILKAHVQGDRVDYAALKADREPLDAYAKSLYAVTPRELKSFSREEQFAFWINVYNTTVLRLIVDAFPIGSINDLSARGEGQIWDRGVIPMQAHHPEGKQERLSLNDVENKILRPVFQDARVHAAINCGAASCPPLLDEAFAGAKLDAQLQSQMKKFVNDRSRNRYDRSGKKIALSHIFEWFRDDFVRDAGGVKPYLVRFVDGDASWLREAEVSFVDYSWDLHVVKSR